MRIKKILAVLLSLPVLMAGSIHAQEKIYINLFSELSIQSFIFSPVKSCYLLYMDSVFTDSLFPGEVIYASFLNNQVQVRSMERPLGYGSNIYLSACDSIAEFNLRPAYPANPPRLYDDNLIMKPDYNRILAITEVRMDQYIAGVIESEGGTRAPLEYYKAQAVLCRTYALQNIGKHAAEGFHLCDGVHCQAYLSRSDHNDEILQAVIETQGEVAVFNDSILITAAFHSNCGGETQNSENVWVTAAPYLRSVRDPWCRESRNAQWQKSIPLAEWRSYLVSNGVEEAGKKNPSEFKFIQRSRKEFYLVGDDSVPVKKIRNDWMLKSGFFSVTYIAPEKIVIDGRGYGHGIGMCQEGAMSMARKGFDYREILQFYYTGISIRKYP